MFSFQPEVWCPKIKIFRKILLFELFVDKYTQDKRKRKMGFSEATPSIYSCKTTSISLLRMKYISNNTCLQKYTLDTQRAE